MRASILFVASVLPVLSLAKDSEEAMDFLDSVNVCAVRFFLSVPLAILCLYPYQSLIFSTPLVHAPLFLLSADFINASQTSTVKIEAAKNSCGLDIACICRDDDFIATIMTETTCTPTQLVEFGQLVAKECSSHRVTVDIPGGDVGNSGSGNSGSENSGSGNSDSGDSSSGNSGSGNSGSGDSDADKSDTGNTDDKDKNAQDKPNWAGRATMVNLWVMLGVTGMAGLVGV